MKPLHRCPSDSTVFESSAAIARRKRFKNLVSATSGDAFMHVNHKRYMSSGAVHDGGGNDMHAKVLIDKAHSEFATLPSLSSECVRICRGLIRSISFPSQRGRGTISTGTSQIGMENICSVSHSLECNSNSSICGEDLRTQKDVVLSKSSTSLLQYEVHRKKHESTQITISSKLVCSPILNSAKVDVMTSAECPPHGKLAVLGRRRRMEDAVVMVPNFASLTCSAGDGCRDYALHFFGVYDGHGGDQASLYCKKRFHLALAEGISGVFAYRGESGDYDRLASWWTTAMETCFLKVDKEVGGVCPSGQCSDCARSSTCCRDAIAPGSVGSTALVAVVSPQQIIIANCGDSRAVISRAGKAIALSRDHKPELEDERKRIEDAGGLVVNWDGYRVGGLLAMSRALGDRYLKPYVIAEPEVTVYERTGEDECLILASDGLWDNVENDVACKVACRCLATTHRKHKAGLMALKVGETRTSTVAALLTKMALGRGSNDNISVIVLDLKS